MEMEMQAGVETMPDALFVRMQAAAEALEQAAGRLAEAEITIATLRAQAASNTGRKTTVAATLVAKEGVAMEAGALDAALSTLSLEQRIAVKAQLLRSGLLG
jgi:hypothetical protein